MQNTVQFLDHSTIQARAPAIFSERAAPDCSDRYKHIHSAQVLSHFEARDWGVTHVRQDHPTRRDSRFVRHMVRLSPRSADPDTFRTLGKVMPQYLFTNSHNGRTKARLELGLFRLVCLNGMVAGSSFQKFEFPHIGDVHRTLDSALDAFAECEERLLTRVTELQNKQLTDRQVNRFARRARALRFGATAEAYSVEDVLQVRRVDDQGNSLWNVLNRVQENLMSQTLSGRNANNRRISSRRITGIASDINMNRQLWDLAETYAEAA